MSRSRRPIFAVATILMFLLGAEGLARLLPDEAAAAVTGAALRFDQNPELQEGNARYWQPDPLLFWRMRPNLEVDFGGMPLRTNAAGFRDPPHMREMDRPLVICLGDSTTFGWGVMDPVDRYSDRLATTLSGAQPSATQVFNFGQSGYSTVQGRRLLEEEALPLNPAAVIFLFGPNDYALASGRSDRDQPVAARGGVTAQAQSVLHHSAFYRRLAAALVKARDSRRGQQSPPSAGSDRLSTASRRVPLDQFKQNLEEMIASTRKAGAQPILATYPRRPLNPLLPCPPPEDAAELGRWRDQVQNQAAPLQELVGQILSGEAGSPDDALALWREMPAQVSGTASALYGEAWLLQQGGHTQEAEQALMAAGKQAEESGCGLDLFSTRLFRYLEEPAAAAYNQAIRLVAREQSVPLVDSAARLTQAQQTLVNTLQVEGPAMMEPSDPSRHSSATSTLALWFGSGSYFVDVVHPSARGHAILATDMAERIARHLPDPRN